MATRMKTNGLGWAAKEAVERIRSIARLEVELALLEIKRKLVRIALGAGLAAGAALLLLFALGFGAAGGAAAIATKIPVWAALLIVAGGLLLLAGGVFWIALRALRSGTPPLPEEAIEEARKTTETIMRNGA
jgi:hypothetical protein